MTIELLVVSLQLQIRVLYVKLALEILHPTLFHNYCYGGEDEAIKCFTPHTLDLMFAKLIIICLLLDGCLTFSLLVIIFNQLGLQFLQIWMDIPERVRIKFKAYIFLQRALIKRHNMDLKAARLLRLQELQPFFKIFFVVASEDPDLSSMVMIGIFLE